MQTTTFSMVLIAMLSFGAPAWAGAPAQGKVVAHAPTRAKRIKLRNRLSRKTAVIGITIAAGLGAALGVPLESNPFIALMPLEGGAAGAMMTGGAAGFVWGAVAGHRNRRFSSAMIGTGLGAASAFALYGPMFETMIAHPMATLAATGAAIGGGARAIRAAAGSVLSRLMPRRRK